MFSKKSVLSLFLEDIIRTFKLETISQEVGDDINTYLGIAINENLDDEIIVTVIATGFEDDKDDTDQQTVVKESSPVSESSTYSPFDDDEDDDAGVPTFIRNRRI